MCLDREGGSEEGEGWKCSTTTTALKGAALNLEGERSRRGRGKKSALCTQRRLVDIRVLEEETPVKVLGKKTAPSCLTDRARPSPLLKAFHFPQKN